MKHLIIRNFGPIKEVDIDLKRINLVIGPQSSGKSTVLKIACFCDWMERQVELTQSPEKFCNSSVINSNLINFHKLKGFLFSDTYISYKNDAVSFEFSNKHLKENDKWSFKWDNSKRWKYKRRKIAYIPSERNLVAAIPNWFEVSMGEDNFLDFMQEWEFARKSFPEGEHILNLPATYKYNPVNQTDSIVLPDGKELDLTMASSGLQSLTPLFIMLRYLTAEYFKQTHTNVEEKMLRKNLIDIVAKECATLTTEKQKEIVDNLLVPHHTDLFIEEPEAHIFPSTQKSFVYSLAKMLNGKYKHSCFISTHSPYIMTSFNNLILAGEKIAESKAKQQVLKKIQESEVLHYSEVAAFEIKEGKSHSIMDNEFGLISAEAIDSASKEIGDDFDFLLNL